MGAGTAIGAGLSVSSPVSAAPGTYTGESYSGNAVSYYGKYVPTGYDGSESVPLVVMLHGCTQTADGFKDESLMNETAEENGFIVVYPETNQHMNDCWRWWADGHTTRGNGEAADIKGIVDEVKSDENVDDQRVYVAGFSAGGGSTADLAVEYADVFAAVGTHSGFAYDVVESQMEGVMEMTNCSADPQALGTQAKDAMDSYGITSKVPTVVFHGTTDSTVVTCNGENATEQACQTNDLVDNGSDDDSIAYGSPDATETVSGSSLSGTRSVYNDENGNPLIEEYIIDSMGHGWAGGATSGSYTAPGAPSASDRMWDLFSQWTVDGYDDGSGGGGNDAPTASASADDTSVQVNDTVNFDGTNSSDPDGSIASYDWDFDDGSTATGATPSHSFDSTGTYSVELTVTDDDNATDTDTVTISVSDGSGNSPPNASFTASPTDADVDETVSFDASGSSDPDGNIVSYDWDFDDGSTATGQSPSHSFDSEGSYTVTLTVTDDDNATDSTTETVTVESASFDGYCGSASNYDHVQAGRAYNSFGTVYAEGSDDEMGLYNIYASTTLEETSEGYFEVVDSCSDDGGDDGGWWS